MAQFLMFMPRQTLMGGTGGTTLYSEVYDVAGVKELSGFFRVLSTSDASAVYTGGLEGTDDPSMSGFVSSGFSGMTVTGTGTISGWGGAPKRFVRGVVTIPSTKFAIVEFYARGF
jgi:hypothetical protein